MKATLSRARISPKKINLVAGLVRRKGVQEALDILAFTPKKGARLLRKVIASAVANAENNFAQDKSKLIVRSILVHEAPVIKRWLPIARGSAHPILKRNAHIVVEVGFDEESLPSDSSSVSTKQKRVQKEVVAVVPKKKSVPDKEKSVSKTFSKKSSSKKSSS